MIPKLLHRHYGPELDQSPIVSLTRQDLWIALGLAGLVILLGAWQMVVGVCGVYHDDAIYVITAKALAQGKGYRLIDLPHSPLQTKYPIFYPALLAIIWKIWPSFPQNLLAMQGLSLFCGAGTIALAYLFLVRFNYASRKLALLACLFCATSAPFLYFSTLTLSETSFALISILALWAIEKHTWSPNDKVGIQISLGLLLALPFLTRAIGIVLIPAGFLTCYLAGRNIRWIGLGAAMIGLPWIAWMLIGPRWSLNPVYTYYTNYASWWSCFGWSNLAKLLLVNIFYTTNSIPINCFAFLADISKYFGIIYIIYIFIGSITILEILAQIFYKRLLSFYLVFYLAIILIWPWPPARFLIPILPFLLLYLLSVVWKITKIYKPLSNSKILFICYIIILSINFALVYQVGKRARSMCYPSVYTMKEPVAWSSYKDIFHWINNHTLPDDVIASGLDSMVYLYTGRQAFRPFMMNPMALFYFQQIPPWTMKDFIHILKIFQPKYLIETPMPWFSEEKPFSKIINETILSYPSLLKKVYEEKDKRFVVYQIEPNQLAAAKK